MNSDAVAVTPASWRIITYAQGGDNKEIGTHHHHRPPPRRATPTAPCARHTRISSETEPPPWQGRGRDGAGTGRQIEGKPRRNHCSAAELSVNGRREPAGAARTDASEGGLCLHICTARHPPPPPPSYMRRAGPRTPASPQLVSPSLGRAAHASPRAFVPHRSSYLDQEILLI